VSGKPRHEREYYSWKGMVSRCTDPRNIGFRDYGGRGIKVCERWLNFAHFYADMGDKPTPKHSIDRIDNNGHYEPSNCRWADLEQQNNNRRSSRFITINGATKSVTQWARFVGVPARLIFGRLNKGWSDADAVMTKFMKQRGGGIRAAKLTERQVIDLRKERSGGATLEALAKKYKVGSAQVSRICSRTDWVHIP
jgi:hypothetical protein